MPVKEQCNIDYVIEGSSESQIMKVRARYDRTPKTRGEQLLVYLQRLELLEKIAEIVDESFHLFNTLLQRYASIPVYQTLRNLHHGAHDFEHVLHAFCFIGDASRIHMGKFFHDHEGKRLNLLICLARICHAVAHFFASLDFLKSLKAGSLNQYPNLLFYSHLFSTAGYALSTAQLVWSRTYGDSCDHLSDDLSIHGGGCLFEAMSLLGETEGLPSLVEFIAGKVGAFAGILHASAVVNQLMPPDVVEFKTEFNLTDFQDKSKLTEPDNHLTGHSAPNSYCISCIIK